MLSKVYTIILFFLKCIVPFEGREVKINMNITADDGSSKAQINIFHPRLMMRWTAESHDWSARLNIFPGFCCLKKSVTAQKWSVWFPSLANSPSRAKRSIMQSIIDQQQPATIHSSDPSIRLPSPLKRNSDEEEEASKVCCFAFQRGKQAL